MAKALAFPTGYVASLYMCMSEYVPVALMKTDINGSELIWKQNEDGSLEGTGGENILHRWSLQHDDVG